MDSVPRWISPAIGARKKPVDGSDVAVGLAVGAGGPTGGPFIDAALEVLTDRTTWEPASAVRVVGTSAGAFVAARLPAPSAGVPDAVAALRSVANGCEMKATIGTQVLRGLRLLGGRVFALLAPPERDRALYDVAPPPYHPGATVVTIEHTWGVRHQHNLSENEDLAEAMVQASAAIPYKNGPIRIDGRLHADGAVHSANNVDLLDPDECPIVVVISPMIPDSGGSFASKFHRAQLFEELRPWGVEGRAAIVIMPTEEEHKNRRDRDAFTRAGARSAERLFEVAAT